jgi:hypothetical protein
VFVIFRYLGNSGIVSFSKKVMLFRVTCLVLSLPASYSEQAGTTNLREIFGGFPAFFFTYLKVGHYLFLLFAAFKIS